jgi:hypothetical protein
MSRTLIRISLSLLLLASVPFLSAQLSTAVVNGVVRDSTGSIIPGATIVLKNTATGVERRATSNESGNYAFLDISPGTYTLETSKEGFSKQALSPFTLAVNQTATLNFTLQLGSISQSVTVEAVGAEVQASTAELGAVVTQKQVVDLPLNGRNFTQLLSLTPGVAPVNVSQNSSSSWIASPIGTFVFPSVNGQTNRSNFFMMDGGIDDAPYTSTYAVPPIIDSIQEFKVQSHNDQAEFSGALGSIVNVVTKSGTNAVHGSAWEYLRNDAFDARNTFLAKVTPFRQNMFGGTVGGPVVLPKLYDGHNRTFFFLGYQGFRFTQSASNLFRVPTDANLAGDLSDQPRAIYNPFTTRPDPARSGSYIRDPFPGNQIPQSLIDPGMVAYARATLPSPTFTGVADRNGLDTTPFIQSQEEYTARIDQNLGAKDFVWFRYSGRRLDTNSSGGRQALASINENRSYNWSTSWVRTFSPSSVMQVQFTDNVVRDPYGTRYRSLPANFAQEVGFADSFVNHFAGNATFIPGLNVADYFSGGEGGILKSKPVDIQQWKGAFSKIMGSHNVKIGGEISSTTHFNQVTQIASNYTAFQTADPENPGSTGSALASFLLNVPDNASRRNTYDTTRWGGVLGLFIQDQWKVTSRLTMNIGFRYDRTFLPPYGRPEDHNMQVGSLDLNTGTYLLQQLAPACDVAGQAPCIPTPGGVLPPHVAVEPRGKIYHDWDDNFQPRFGLAYRLSDRTAIRTGFGIFFENWAAINQAAQNYSGTWPTVTQQYANNLNVPSPGAVTPVIKGTNPFTTGLFPAPDPFGQVQYYMDPYAKNAYSMQWNVGIQHQLNQSTVLTMTYVGSGTRRLDIGGTYNTALMPGPGNPQSRALYPYITPTNYDRSWGRSNYNAFQFLLDKKYNGGLAYMVSYTYSKSIDIGCSGWFGVEGCSIQDPYHFNNDRSVSAFDLPHILSVNLVYELPIGKGKLLRTGSSVADYILGNWQVNAIGTFRSGTPYNLVVSGDIANTGNAGNYERPNLIGDPQIDNPTPAKWFNTAAFQAPAPFTFGNFGRNVLRSEWLRNVDFSMFRAFPIREGLRVEFRAEAFNGFNTPIYAAPTANLSSPNFGRVLSTANNPRQLQLGAKIIF